MMNPNQPRTVGLPQPMTAPQPAPVIPIGPDPAQRKLIQAMMAKQMQELSQARTPQEAVGRALPLYAATFRDYQDKQAAKERQEALTKALTGATDYDSLIGAMVSSGDPDYQKAALSQRLSQWAPKAPEKPTGTMREYEFARSQGYPGSFTDYQTDLKKAGSPAVNVNTKQETEYGKTRGKALAEEFGAVMDNSRKARDRITQLKTIDGLLSDPNVYTGSGAESINAIKRFGKSFLGLDLEGVGPADAARRVVNTMALSYKDDLPGPMSNADREFLQSIPPNISDTAEGRKLLVQLEIAKERRKIEIGQLARRYRQENGQLDDGWYDVLANFNENSPLVTPKMLDLAKKAAAGAPQPSPGAGVPLEFKQKWNLE